MGITARWYDEARRIWYEEVSDIWTVDEYWESVEATHRALDAVAPQPVYLITLARGPVRIPPGFITALRNVSIQRAPTNAFTSSSAAARWCARCIAFATSSTSRSPFIWSTR